jgi:hypothetical protein
MSPLIIPGGIQVQRPHLWIPGGSAPFGPSSIAGLSLWLDASDSGTITKDGSNKVSQWNDKSGNGNNAYQGSSTSQPIYNSTGLSSLLPALTQSSVEYLNLTALLGFSPATMFAVTALNSISSGNNPLFGCNPGGAPINGFWSRFSPGQLEEYDGDGNGHFAVRVSSGLSALTANQAFLQSHVIGATSSAADTKVYFNQTLMNDGGSGGTWAVAPIALIGCNHPVNDHFKGSYSELVVYNSVLSDSDRGDVENYLISKWGL